MAFYKTTLGCTMFDETILRDGLALQFTSEPGPYFRRNNRSARLHSQKLFDTVQKWHGLGFVAVAPTQPLVVSPMTVASQRDHVTGETKLRPCLDGSRHLNKFLPDRKIKLTTLEISKQMIEEGDWLMGVDLENCFFHVRIRPDFWKYLGFQVQNPTTGESTFYVFKRMIYGLKVAPSVIDQLTRPIVRHLHTLGIRFSLMCDDGLTMANSKSRAEADHQKVLDVFQCAG
ncbi:reverse transcriptase domain-containing protein, partial [Litorimonas sp.]|uniref:reverse transcriptase domain-containing protein n=1 Tax=Litorimonas sp. TaxID=1892381 RepID=UPI003A8A0B7A